MRLGRPFIWDANAPITRPEAAEGIDVSTTINKPRRVVGLIRVSALRGRGGETFHSVPVQKEEILRGLSRDDEVVEWIEELDQPGDAHRPGLERAIGVVEAGLADGIAVMKLNRLGRNTMGLYEAVERIKAAGGTVVFAQEKLDLTTTSGKVLVRRVGRHGRGRARGDRRQLEGRQSAVARTRRLRRQGALRLPQRHQARSPRRQLRAAHRARGGEGRAAPV